MDHDHGSGSGGAGNETGNSGGNGMAMSMYFYASEHATILFKEWHTMTAAELFGSCVAVAVLAFLYEALKVGRELLSERTAARSPSVADFSSTDDQSKSTDEYPSSSTSITMRKKTNDGHSRGWRSHQICRSGHFVQTILHFIQLWCSLSLMLIFMTYNVYLCLAVTVGGALGYFCFGWAYKRQSINGAEMCH